ncbi:spirocyclase AveC family protein [Mycobacterium sp. CVI_P3]|uniref:Spirocyclase AveC family protein n=1 Tax=Mycobacterium pinniadriaticum TaxID=2994102 RepID=A0ABT3S9S2_9MYCO|nr:spirocyclase AveC family protein [Mycobacterium pinniadriaticum]MCX2930090.1 spirocyclase AveC family protein [Mycobacterium pinniadriaticum]MCX2936261.1 spirocyclase AveC family protein [Mycobacterium pinniadriaticum]
MSTVSADHRTSFPTSVPARQVPAPVILAVIGGLIVAYALWTWGAWLASAPAPVSATRDSADMSWWVARAYETIMVIAVAVIGTYVVRQCVRQGRLAFDAIIVIAGFFTLFWDPMVNWMQPNFMYSSQWLNVNTWVAQAPGVVNPTAGLMPQPVFIMLIYPFGLLGFAIIINHGMRLVQRRFPQISTFALMAFAYGYGLILGGCLEAPTFLSNLWGLPGAPADFSLFSNGQRYAWAEYLTTGIVFTTFAAVRYFKNDKGETIVERGLQSFRPAAKTVVTVFATIAVFAMSMWALLLVQIPAGLHASPYPDDYPAHLINGLCNIPGNPNSTVPTAYGPCPGSPGFRMPVNNTFVPDTGH